MKDNPCYNRQTKQSCSRRCCGCAKDCKEWAEYVAERDSCYEKKKEMHMMDGYEIARNKKIKKYLKRYGKYKT